MFVPFTSSLRYVHPRVEQRLKDRRSGAYPTKARTGDRTRTGRNAYFFDDTRTVIFQDNVSVSLPTTFRSGSTHLTLELRSDFFVTGNTIPKAVDQWIPHREQLENPGPFVESKLFEQDEHGVVNSVFMTGSAFGIAPDRFKSNVADKTIIRMEFPLHTKSTLLPTTSSIAYFNPTAGRFENTVLETSFNLNGGGYPSTFAPIIFTPYGLHYMPLNDYKASSYGGGVASIGTLPAKEAYRRATSYAADGTDSPFYIGSSGYELGYVTASLLNSSHAAHASQSIVMKTRLSDPFLIEKIVVEFPFEAGPGWLNDCFGTSHVMENDLSYTIDSGGPMITFALLRQDKNANRSRDLIASATIASVNDVKRGSYKRSQASYSGVGGYDDIIYTHEGVGGLGINPTVVITGSNSPAGSNNSFTGTVKFVMEPQVTSHVWRARVSGSNYWYYGASATGDSRPNQANGLTFGPIARRSAKHLGAGRSILGNHFAFIDLNRLDGVLNPLVGIDTQYENLPQDTVAPRFSTSKIYTDVISKTSKSPYLIYPEDDLVLCFNKHRACGSNDAAQWDFFGPNAEVTPFALSASHDVGIGTGLFKITLYGDLIREDREYHNTLNQRLETEEIWENIGEEPILDQFDVTYGFELSGSYLDRCNIFTQIPYMADELLPANLSSIILDYNRDPGHFAEGGAVDNANWKRIGYTEHSWANWKFAWELRKSNRNPVLTSDELFWDTRIPRPSAVMASCNALYCLTTDGISCLEMGTAYSGNISDMHGGASIGTSGNGILDWYMSYPYETRYKLLDYTFYSNLNKDLFAVSSPGYHGSPLRHDELDYNALSLEIGSLSGSSPVIASRFIASEGSIGQTRYGTGYLPLRKPEFIKFFFGIGDGVSEVDNQHVRGRSGNSTSPVTANIRGWRYGMLNAFPVYTTSVFRRDRFGQFRDMLEQRVDSKFYNSITLDNVAAGVKDSPVQVKFYDQKGVSTSPTRTLSSNLSTEATSSMPYTDGVARNRSAITYDNVNITRVIS